MHIQILARSTAGWKEMTVGILGRPSPSHSGHSWSKEVASVIPCLLYYKINVLQQMREEPCV